MVFVCYFFAVFKGITPFIRKNEFKNVRLSLFPKDIYISETMEDGHFHVQKLCLVFPLTMYQAKILLVSFSHLIYFIIPYIYSFVKLERVFQNSNFGLDCILP